MNHHRIFALILALVLLLSCSALADSGYDFDATVVCVEPEYVLAAIGGTVESVPVMAGQLVASGDTLVTLSTTKIYAAEDGVVTGVFAQPGDSTSAVAERYGALLYIEPDSKYVIKASTSNSYAAADNKYVHVGETVYLMCTSDGAHTGEGVVTAVSGEDFTVEVTSGDFYMGETVSVCRDSGYLSKSRIGRGDIERSDNIAVTAGNDSGSVVKVHVQDGDEVKAGDLLVETLSGEYDAYYCTGSALASDADGILASISATVGGKVSKGDVIATVYPRENLVMEVALNETNLTELNVGDAVEISFNWNADADGAVCQGVVTDILYTAAASGAGADSESTASYTAYIDFEADENVRIGMTAIVYPVSSEAAAAEEAPAEDPNGIG